mmetsp:Transcript_75837/g.226100  ORF Transcript_75837/g.226100 Transcript_75837/m.226100 type:complete len:205 (-) Transcript_75837:219-833(-)
MPVLEERGLLVGAGDHADGLALAHELLEGAPAAVPEAAVRPLEGVTQGPSEEPLVPQGPVDEVEAAPGDVVEVPAPHDVGDPAHREHAVRVAREEAPPKLDAVERPTYLAALVVPAVEPALEVHERRTWPADALQAVEQRHPRGHNGGEQRQLVPRQRGRGHGDAEHDARRDALVHLHEHAEHGYGNHEPAQPADVRLQAARQA